MSPLGDALPSGTLTFLFTDIEESTRHLRRLGKKYGFLIAEHASLVRETLAAHGGREVDTQGDAFFAVFSRARDALSAAAVIQKKLATHDWPENVRLRVRIGIHTGEPELEADRYFGIDIHRAARICSAARGGETLVSALSASLVIEQLPAGVRLVEHGRVQLKDFPTPDLLYRLVVEGLPEQDLDAGTDREPFRGNYDALAARIKDDLSSGTTEEVAPSPRHLLTVAPSAAVLERLTSFSQLLATTLGADLTLACVTRKDEALPADALDRIHRRLRARGIESKAITFRTDDPGTAIDKLSARENLGWVIVGGGNGDEPSPFESSILAAASALTLLHVPGAEEETEAIFVPFSGSDHDWAALELASRIASALEVRIVLIGNDSPAASADEDASRLLASASLVLQQLAHILPELLLLPPGARPLLQQMKPNSHLITGVPLDFDKRGLGETRAELLRDHSGAQTFVRASRRASGRGPSPTRFSWTLTTPGLDPKHP